MMSRGMSSIVVLALALVAGCNRKEAPKDRQADNSEQLDPLTTAAMEQGSKEAALVKSASNLRYVGKAMNAYAAAHAGAWPNALTDISSSDELLDPSDIKCPMSGRTYVYRKPGPSSDPSSVVVFEQPSSKSDFGNGINILRRNGEVEAVYGDEAKKITGF